MPPRPESCEIRIRVTPRSSRNKIEAAGSGEFKVWVTAPPVDGEANEAVRQLIAKALGIAKSNVSVVGGETSRSKTLRVEGLGLTDVAERLNA